MCVCKRSRTVRSSIRMGWDHMVSEVSVERIVLSKLPTTFQTGVWKSVLYLHKYSCSVLDKVSF